MAETAPAPSRAPFQEAANVNQTKAGGAPRGSPAPTDTTGTCKYCGKPIVFRETPSGALQPWDIDPGTGELTGVHFASCPKQAEARRQRRVREGKPADVPLDRCHLPACGSPDLVYLAPTGKGGNGHLWASRCPACGIHRFLPQAFVPPADALPVEAPPPGGPPATLPALRAWRRPEWDYAWGWRAGGGWDWWPKLPADPSDPSFPPVGGRGW